MPNIREKLIGIICKKPYNMSRISAGMLADHLIANGVTVSDCNKDCANCWKTQLVTPRWIPVTERLPQGADGKSLCKNVIAYTIDGQVVPGWLNGAYWYLLLQDDTAFTRLERDCVSHWMPLPEPPENDYGR